MSNLFTYFVPVSNTWAWCPPLYSWRGLVILTLASMSWGLSANPFFFFTIGTNGLFSLLMAGRAYRSRTWHEKSRHIFPTSPLMENIFPEDLQDLSSQGSFHSLYPSLDRKKKEKTALTSETEIPKWGKNVSLNLFLQQSLVKLRYVCKLRPQRGIQINSRGSVSPPRSPPSCKKWNSGNRTLGALQHHTASLMRFHTSHCHFLLSCTRPTSQTQTNTHSHTHTLWST